MAKNLVGIFETDAAILAAARDARAQGLTVSDAFTPYPVHGMDQAMGLPPSWLSRACFILGALGLSGALGFQYWVSLFDWPINIGGKSFDASPALIPIAFEITVLVSGVGTVVTLLLSRGLLPGRRPRLSGLRATDDRFLLVVEGAPEAKLRQFHLSHGALAVESVEEAIR